MEDPGHLDDGLPMREAKKRGGGHEPFVHDECLVAKRDSCCNKYCTMNDEVNTPACVNRVRRNAELGQRVGEQGLL